MSEVRLEQLTKRFGETVAVNAVDLDIGDGEFISLLGPSGCGKSTLLSTIAGLLEATSGAIYVDRHRVERVAPKDRGMAMVFQDYALYPHMSVYENLAFPLKAQRMSSTDMRHTIDDAAKILGIETLLSRLPKQLSGGQRQRVALGRAIVRHPKVFLMDEPLSNLDARLRIHMRKELKLLHQRLRTTTIYVTHDQTEAMTLSDRVAIMHGGVLQQVDTPLTVYEQPRNLFVAGFIGQVPMNFLHCRVERVNGTVCVKSDGFKYQPCARTAEYLVPYTDKAVVLGVRGEHVEVCSQEEESDICVEVDILEQMGSDLYVYTNVGGQELVIRTPPTFQTQAGDRLHVRFQEDRVRFFDYETEMALNLNLPGD